MIVFITSDHAGFEVKSIVLKHFSNTIDIRDIGPNSDEKSDYPIYAKMLAESVSSTPESYGIAICGTGIGMSIATNKINGIRAALCMDANMARLCRKHNNANIICLGTRITTIETILTSIEEFLSTDFFEEKHGNRVQMITEMES